ncbi:putative dehydrogenase (ISS) [Dorcoceras hygrometricum]|uniref:Putative dehydrogenase (ISS) n=1 Tax=Dorcoceras hygrometricum TaxID=472368 RepID=A0A2Z7D7T7_9LAMI|nr:putative dehydrogenase (ISS) [Dorcoceras hygrometricum]
MSASGESSTTMHRLLHASGSHPIPPPNDPKTALVVVHSSPDGTVIARATRKLSDVIPNLCVNALEINEWVGPESSKIMTSDWSCGTTATGAQRSSPSVGIKSRRSSPASFKPSEPKDPACSI